MITLSKINTWYRQEHYQVGAKIHYKINTTINEQTNYQGDIWKVVNRGTLAPHQPRHIQVFWEIFWEVERKID